MSWYVRGYKYLFTLNPRFYIYLKFTIILRSRSEEEKRKTKQKKNEKKQKETKKQKKKSREDKKASKPIELVLQRGRRTGRNEIRPLLAWDTNCEIRDNSRTQYARAQTGEIRYNERRDEN